MKITKILLPSAVVATTAIFALPTEQLQAFTTIGGNLPVGERWYRVHNAFADSASNNNNNADPNFPGSLGAVLAVRKGAVEWGSQTYGNGSGDPTQANLGDGGANFDFFFAGETMGNGGSNGNTVGVLSSGCSGGTLAFMDPGFGINDGWNIKFCDQNANFADGPGTIGISQFDLQADACHELGHALGLGHSGTGTATMAPFINNGSEGERSINFDDQAGVQFIYGVKSGSKPEIDSVSVSSGQVTIQGSNFATNGNSVWFTEQNPASVNGVIVSNVSSTAGGTQIQVTLPVGAVSGDIMVNNGTGGGASLTNAYPLDATDTGPPPPTIYCIGKLSSAFCLAQLTTSNPSAPPVSGANDYDLIANGVQEFKNGLFFGSISGQAMIPFSGGTLCKNPPTFRTGIQNSGGANPSGCNGQMVLTINNGLGIPFGPDAGSGQMSWMQLWYRDPANGVGNLGTALSDAVEFEWL